MGRKRKTLGTDGTTETQVDVAGSDQEGTEGDDQTEPSGQEVPTEPELKEEDVSVPTGGGESEAQVIVEPVQAVLPVTLEPESHELLSGRPSLLDGLESQIQEMLASGKEVGVKEPEVEPLALSQVEYPVERGEKVVRSKCCVHCKRSDQMKEGSVEEVIDLKEKGVFKAMLPVDQCKNCGSQVVQAEAMDLFVDYVRRMLGKQDPVLGQVTA